VGHGECDGPDPPLLVMGVDALTDPSRDCQGILDCVCGKRPLDILAEAGKGFDVDGALQQLRQLPRVQQLRISMNADHRGALPRWNPVL
jgi:hypothetical protein